MACLSGILMGAFTVSVVIADVWFWHTRRVIPHIFLGGLTTALFFALCQRGYEYVNWSLLGLVVVFALLKSIIVFPDSEPVSNDTNDTVPCSCVERPKCSCQRPKCAKRIATCNPMGTV